MSLLLWLLGGALLAGAVLVISAGKLADMIRRKIPWANRAIVKKIIERAGKVIIKIAWNSMFESGYSQFEIPVEDNKYSIDIFEGEKIEL